MRLFFDNEGGKYPSNRTQYVGRILNANSIAGDENFIRIVVSDQNVIDFLKSWEEDMSKSPVNVTIRKTIYLMDDTNSTTACVSSYIKNLKKDGRWWSSGPIDGAYEVRLIPKYIDFLGKSKADLLKSIMVVGNRDNKINQILDGETNV